MSQQTPDDRIKENYNHILPYFNAFMNGSQLVYRAKLPSLPEDKNQRMKS